VTGAHGKGAEYCIAVITRLTAMQDLPGRPEGLRAADGIQGDTLA
jgi:hypothetical protein